MSAAAGGGVASVAGYFAFGWTLLILVSLCLGIISVFVVHSVALWGSSDPEKAFHRTRELVGYGSTGWNTIAQLLNMVLYLFTMWVPGYNMLAKHYIEPIIWIVVDVLSLVFAHRHYNGIVSEDQVPFLGHYCGGNPDGSAMDAKTAKYHSHIHSHRRSHSHRHSRTDRNPQNKHTPTAQPRTLQGCTRRRLRCVCVYVCVCV